MSYNFQKAADSLISAKIATYLSQKSRVGSVLGDITRLLEICPYHDFVKSINKEASTM